MARSDGTKKKGLFAGFLSGSAICLSLSAVASYMSPIDAAKTTVADVTEAETVVEPVVDSADVKSVSPKAEAPNIAVVTPKSDSQRGFKKVPDYDPPEADRDTANVAVTVQEITDPVQTETPQIAAPRATDPVETQTAKVEDAAPSAPTVTPLATAETAPERSDVNVDVSSSDTAAPDVEASDLESPTADDAPVTLALNAPKVAVNEDADKPVDMAAPQKPAVPEAATPQSDENAPALEAPSIGEAPKAEPVIALNLPKVPAVQPPVQMSPPEDSIQPDLEDEETKITSDPAPAVNDAPADNAGEPEIATSAPVQVVIPQIKEEPSVSAQDQSGNSDDAEDVGGTTAPDKPAVTTPASRVADRRNPPPPTFSGRAFDAFSVKFIAPNNKPFLTIVLEHVGEGSVDMYDLLNFGKPITFGVRSDDDLAKWRENEFRKAGFEVVALVPDDPVTGLSESMDGGTVPMRIDNYLTAVPGAVAVLDRSTSNMYRDPRKVTQVAGELNLTGRGLLLHEKFGVNRAIEAARSAGIPSASLMRVIDEQRDAASIRRALDRAALDASKTGSAIIFGRTYPETVAAILPWLLGNSARSVTVAPLTSTMNRMVE